MARLTVAIHKLTSCSGCQLAFLNQGETLLSLMRYLDICHFVEGGIFNPTVRADLAFIEGSITTQDELDLVKAIREQSKAVVTMGACATSGGIQALRNFAQITGGTEAIKGQIYASPDFIETLDEAMAVSEVIKVDYELWGCPVSAEQLIAFVSQLLLGAQPAESREKLCMECKRQQNICTLVTKQGLCMGPVTRTGCGALCPSYGKACYGCYGPAEQANNRALANRFSGLGLVDDQSLVRRFAQFHNSSPELKKEIDFMLGEHDDKQKD
ncbi:hypothetical protein L3Q72_15895 [Vibrio sp. JC009]|uniref:NADH-quinone oxidoreductase subunit B family protein n=1 Tax=Vibrio sp. JC009 TaxID=2912314 RepID=UPI0023AEC66C|nr:hypothetical protein [Vibrio sp. JC009]WED24358.1 hypothetical protein L3Q72_15895 [Vibrio sp. JC009]